MTPELLTPEELAELRLNARNLVNRFLGNPTGQAAGMVEQLNDEEAAGIVAAGEVKETARDAIKAVFTGSYERKRNEHAVEATADGVRLRQRSKASRVLAKSGMSAETIAECLPQLSAGEQSILAELDGETDIVEVVAAICNRAKERSLAVAAPLPKVAGHSLPNGFRDVAEVLTSDQEGSEPAVSEDADAAAAEPAAEVAADPAPAVAETPPAVAQPRHAKKGK